jgi:hypothetical protein
VPSGPVPAHPPSSWFPGGVGGLSGPAGRLLDPMVDSASAVIGVRTGEVLVETSGLFSRDKIDTFRLESQGEVGHSASVASLRGSSEVVVWGASQWGLCGFGRVPPPAVAAGKPVERQVVGCDRFDDCVRLSPQWGTTTSRVTNRISINKPLNACVLALFVPSRGAGCAFGLPVDGNPLYARCK